MYLFCSQQQTYHGHWSCHMADSNWAQLLPHVSPSPDQVEKQWWSAVPDQGGQLGGGGGHEWHTPGAQGLHDSYCSIIDIEVCSPFLVQAEGRGGGGKVHCRWRESTYQTKPKVDCGGGTLLLRAIGVIGLLLMIAGDVETNPGPGGNCVYACASWLCK